MAASKKETRSSVPAVELQQKEYKSIDVYESKSKLPSGLYLLGRMIHLCQPVSKGQKQISKNDASKIVANEVRGDWISKNVYPKTERAVAKQIKDDYESLMGYVRYQRSSQKKDEKWTEKAKNFNDVMSSHAYDIRTKNIDLQRSIEADTGVKMTEDDERFYLDNCYGAYVAICTPTVPKDWTKKKKREETRAMSTERKRIKMDELKEVASNLADESENEETNTDHELGANDEPFVPNEEIPHSSNSTPRHTRSNPVTPSSTTHDEAKLKFPDLKIRTGRRSINEALVRCIVQCLSEFKVSHADIAGIMVRTANLVFDQNCQISASPDDDDEADEKDEDSEDEEKQDPPVIRKRKSVGDLTYIFPSKRCISMYLEDAYLLNLKRVANYLTNKEDNVITVGLDDTTKAAGHKLFDIKADHITVQGPSGKKILTTGFMENKSHSGEDGAEAYEEKLKILSILGDCTLDEMKNNIDFWMADRTGDNETFRESMGIPDSKSLKCCAHITLGVDNACDKVFREAEQKIGVHNLISVKVGEKAFSSSSSSIHTLGEIAISKLLSPNHTSHSVSLYSEFVQWMEQEGLERQGFKGFTANRFGRIAQIANQFLKLKDQIIRFFDTVVDINSNKLVLAVSVYIQSDWFSLCCELYGKIADLVIFPLMDLLGIDERGENLKDIRDWYGVKDFFKQKIPEIEELSRNLKDGNGKDRLYSAMLSESAETLRSQLAAMPFFNDILEFEAAADEDLPDPDKLVYAPLTNLGCESEFAWFDNRLKNSGGSELVQSISRKRVICTNGLLVDSSFDTTSDKERSKSWKWARTSEDTLEVKKLERNFLETIK